jgi:hypothetical protein
MAILLAMDLPKSSNPLAMDLKMDVPQKSSRECCTVYIMCISQFNIEIKTELNKKNRF